NPHEIGKHPTILGTRERLHAEVREHRVGVAVRGVARGTGGASAATHLEGDHDALAYLQSAHAVAKRHHFSDALMPQRERLANREDAGCQRQIDVAACDGERTHEGVAVALEPRLGKLTPLNRTGCHACELSPETRLP